MIHSGFTNAKPWRWLSRKRPPCLRAGTDRGARNPEDACLMGHGAGGRAPVRGPMLSKPCLLSAPPMLSALAGVSADAGRPPTPYDALTGLPNRSLFMIRLKNATERGRREPLDYAVLLLDIDDFKGVNKHFGRAAGDYVLIEFSQRVRRLLRPTDTLARIGGDEFAILLTRPGGHEGVWRVTARLCQALRVPFSKRELTLHCRACAGASLGHLPCYRPDDLLRRADQALCRAKQSGKACFAVM